jgi:hypothetical protein
MSSSWMVVTDIRMPPTQTDEGLQIAHCGQSHPQVGVVLQFDAPVYARALLEGACLRFRATGRRFGSVIDPKVVETPAAELGALVPDRDLAVAAEVCTRLPRADSPSRLPNASLLQS